MLNIFVSNDLPTLAATLIDTLATPTQHDPFVPEMIVVPSIGLARWLQYQIAFQRGICSQIEFTYPAHYLWQVLSAQRAELAHVSPLDPKYLVWRIDAWLTSELRQKNTDDIFILLDWLAPVGMNQAQYLTRRYELAQRLARIIHRYWTYRPDWLAAWLTQTSLGLGNHESWQARLWRALADTFGTAYHTHPVLDFLQHPTQLVADKRISLFALDALPPMYWQVFERISTQQTVNTYIRNPCQFYWGDMATQPDISPYLEIDHPLLASWGRHWRHHLDQVLAPGVPYQSFEHFEAPTNDTLLANIQKSVLELAPSLPNEHDAEQDTSIQVHVCASRLREIEVLHDQLLRYFNDSPAHTPADCLIMTTSLLELTPIINAVFASVPTTRYIPYRITGLPPQVDPVIQTFFNLLALPHRDFAAEEILSLLSQPVIADRFDLDIPRIEALHPFLQAAGIRCGYQQQMPSDHPHAMSLHSWRYGLDWLITESINAIDIHDTAHSHLMPLSLLPYLASMAEALDRLAIFAAACQEPLTITAWQCLLNDVIDTLLSTRENPAFTDKIIDIRLAITSLTERMQAQYLACQALTTEPHISLTVLSSALMDELTSKAPGPIPSGSVTFTTMGVFSGVPYPFIALVGLDDDQFPKRRPADELDLIAQHPRRGDEFPRLQDRSCFLDALLSAQHTFYLSYIGFTPRDPQPLPPSPLISELLAFIEKQTHSVHKIVVHHPLHPYSPTTFSPNTRQQSYANEYLTAAQSLSKKTHSPILSNRPSMVLPSPKIEPISLTLPDLIRTICSPTRAWLRQQSGAICKRHETAIPDTEPLCLNHLEQWQLQNKLLTLCQSHKNAADAYTIAESSGWLPHDAVGKIHFEAAWAEIQILYQKLIAQGYSSKPSDVTLQQSVIHLEQAQVELIATFSATQHTQLWLWRLGQFRAKDRIAAWVNHCAWSATQQHHDHTTGYVTTHGLWRGTPMPREIALEQLHVFIEVYRHMHQQPLPASADILWAIQTWIEQKIPIADIPHKISPLWRGSEYQTGESADPYNRLLWGDYTPQALFDIDTVQQLMDISQMLWRHAADYSQE